MFLSALFDVSTRLLIVGGKRVTLTLVFFFFRLLTFFFFPSKRGIYIHSESYFLCIIQTPIRYAHPFCILYYVALYHLLFKYVFID